MPPQAEVTASGLLLISKFFSFEMFLNRKNEDDVVGSELGPRQVA